MRALGAFSPLSLSVVSGVRLLRFINSLLVAIKSGNMLGVLANGGALLFIQWCITFYRMHHRCALWNAPHEYARLCSLNIRVYFAAIVAADVVANVSKNVFRRMFKRMLSGAPSAAPSPVEHSPAFAEHAVSHLLLLRSPIFALSNFCLQINISLSSSLFLSLDCKVCIN